MLQSDSKWNITMHFLFLYPAVWVSVLNASNWKLMRFWEGGRVKSKKWHVQDYVKKQYFNENELHYISYCHTYNRKSIKDYWRSGRRLTSVIESTLKILLPQDVFTAVTLSEHNANQKKYFNFKQSANIVIIWTSGPDAIKLHCVKIQGQWIWNRENLYPQYKRTKLSVLVGILNIIKIKT